MLSNRLIAIEKAFHKLSRAASSNRRLRTCLRLWSIFIRLRDGGRCVSCHDKNNLSAHHICRKSLLPEAQLMTGNGITLCRECHKYVHKGFNGRADLQLPMDAQGGEKIESLTAMYGMLFSDAIERNLPLEQYYFLSDTVLSRFKLFQGYDPLTCFPGSRIEQASLIWNACPLNVRNALIEANSIATDGEPFLPGITVTFK